MVTFCHHAKVHVGLTIAVITVVALGMQFGLLVTAYISTKGFGCQ